MRCLASLGPALVCFLAAAYLFADPVSGTFRRAGVFDGDVHGDPETASAVERSFVRAAGLVVALVGTFFLYLSWICYQVP